MKRTFVRQLKHLALVCLMAPTICLSGQELASDGVSTSIDSAELPDSPGAVAQAISSTPYTSKPTLSKFRRIVPADRSAVPLSAKDKLELSLVGPLTVNAFESSLFSAALSDWRDGAPHYGVDLPAFGQRFGGAKLKQVSDSFFSYGVYASMLHEDPRYYVMGSQHKINKRIIYSASRAVITRRDDGSTGTNWSKLAGIVTATALSNAYYPDRDRTAGRNVSSCLTSIATTAAVNELHEFIGDAIHLVWHKRP